HRAHVLDHLPRLRDDVAADHAPVRVDRHDAGYEQQVARPHRVRVVRDRLRLPRDPVLLAAAHQLCFAKCALSASRPPWKTSTAKKRSQRPIWSRSQSNVVHHSTKLRWPSVTGVTRIVAW